MMDLASTSSAREFYEHTCACACGTPLPIRQWHHWYGIPRFAKGHRPGHVATKKWAEQEQGKHFCECGCGEAIEVLPRHFHAGVPRFRHYHAVRVVPLVSWNKGLGVANKVPPRERAFSFADKVRILQRCGFRCARCRDEHLEVLQFDHVIPVAAGGETRVENGQPLCKTCHREKTRRDNSESALAKSAQRKTCHDKEKE